MKVLSSLEVALVSANRGGKYKDSLHVDYLYDVTKKVFQDMTFRRTCAHGWLVFRCVFPFSWLCFAAVSRLPGQLPLPREFSNLVHHLLSLRSPLFIASFRHGHEVGGDAVSEVKTIRAPVIGRET